MENRQKSWKILHLKYVIRKLKVKGLRLEERPKNFGLRICKYKEFRSQNPESSSQKLFNRGQTTEDGRRKSEVGGKAEGWKIKMMECWNVGERGERIDYFALHIAKLDARRQETGVRSQNVGGKV